MSFVSRALFITQWDNRGQTHTCLDFSIFLSGDVPIPPIGLVYSDAEGPTSSLEMLCRPFWDRPRLGCTRLLDRKPENQSNQ